MSADDNVYEPVEMAPVEETNELIEHFKAQVNRGALRENLKLTPAQRVEKMERLLREMYPPVEVAQNLALREEPTAGAQNGLAMDDAGVDLVEAFKKDIDRTLLIENLKLTPAQRMERFAAFMELVYELRRAGREMRERKASDVS
jgi:hypothetical protein